MSRHLVVLIHGIRTRRTSASWPKHFAGWLAAQGLAGVSTEALYYETGPWPLANHLLRNPRLARDVASRIETRHLYDAGPRVHFVAHSNGASIALRAIRRLADRAGIPTASAILTGAAIHSDVERSGLADLVSGGWLGRAVAYSSPEDGVARPALEWVPGLYGALGSRGFRRGGRETGLRIHARQPIGAGGDWGAERIPFVTRWFPDFGHGEYFAEEEREETFRCIAGDLGLEVC